MSLFKNKDIDTILLSFVDLINDFPIIKLINKYYHDRILRHDSYKLLLELREYKATHSRINDSDYINTTNNDINLFEIIQCAFIWCCYVGQLYVVIQNKL